jgi:hypothetical protein
MRLRVEGKPAEIKALVFLLRKMATITVLDEHRDYENRPPSRLVRRYLKIEFRDVPEEELKEDGEP